MSILRTRKLRLGFGGPTLLDGVDLAIEAGERVCLVGRNGSGKSTLLKLLEGRIAPDEGEIEVQQGLKITSLDQHLPEGFTGSVFDCVSEGLGELGALMQRFHQLSAQLAGQSDDRLLAQMEHTQHELETRGGWSLEQRVETAISRLSLDADAEVQSLSGGVQRRVLLARALVAEPDLLLLDESTNHLDISAIEWLEEFLLGFRGTLLFITHDRSFLSALATRIIDLDRGVLTDWPGDYATYLRRKQDWLDNEAGQQALFDKKLAEEERWIRQGIKARRTRNEGRVRALEKMREQRRQRRQITGKVKLHTQQLDTSGKLVAEAVDVDYSIGGRWLIHHFSTTILRGDKIGLIGPNGVGKTTLLRLLLGELQADAGHIRLGTNLEIAYFDQRRALLDMQQSVIDNLSDGREFIDIKGQQRHVISYLQDFLFAPERCRTPVFALSGGERNRLLLAKLFSKPANLLVMDEPTNDLDIDTLDLLEELLVDYAGTVLLVSHDRTFLDRVVTSSLVFEGEGQVNEYVGGYSDWQRQRRADKPSAGATRPTPAPKPPEKPARANKLSYKDQRELDQLPQRIEQLEAELDALHRQMADPAFYRQDGARISEQKEQLVSLEAELKQAYARWEILEP